MSKAKTAGGSVKFSPPTAAQVLSSGFVAPASPADAPPRILAELRADDLLSSGATEEALAIYRSMKSTSWRVREKIGACCYLLHRWQECAKVLEDAPSRPEALCNMLLLESLDSMFAETPDRETRRKMQAPARVLLTLPNPAAREFILADWCIDDQAMRATFAAKAFGLYPADGQIRRNYINSLRRLGGATGDELFALAAQGADAADATLRDLWLAFELAGGRHAIALSYLTKIEALAWVKLPEFELARGDTLVIAGDLSGACDAYTEALAGLAPHQGNQAAILGAIRGLIVATAKAGDNAEAARLAERLVHRFSQYPDAFFKQSSILEGEPVAIMLNDQHEWYMPVTDLFGLRELLLDAVEDDALRGVLRVAFANYNGPRFEMTPGQKSAELWQASNETDCPTVARILGWHFLEEGEENAAGALFARYELARSEDDAEPLDDASMFHRIEGKAAPDIEEFARGMLSELTKCAHSTPKAVAQRGHALFTALVREGLLERKAYHLFEEIARTIATAAPLHEMPAGAHFDHGLGAHYLQRSEDAIEAYKRCLAVDPEHDAAMTNLQMLVPRAEKERLIVERVKSGFPTVATEPALEAITFSNAVYLLSLVRACGGLEQDRILRPFSEGELPFAPHRDNLQPLFHLLRTGLVKIGEESPLTAFDVDLPTNAVVGYRFPQMFWEIPEAVLALVRRIEEAALTGAWPAPWRLEAPDLARNIARGECLAYLDYVASERQLGVPAGEKTKMMIDNVLTTHSVGQAFGILWKAAVGAADFSQRTNVTPQHAGNTIVGNAQRYVDLARAEGYDLKVFSRQKNLPRSHLSFTLHDTFLRTGTRCFDEPLPALFAGAWPYGLTPPAPLKKRKP